MIKRLAILVMLSSLTACGFKPLYATRDTQGVVHSDYAAVAIEPLEGRIGHSLYSNLTEIMHPRGRQQNAQYRLIVSLKERKEGLAIAEDETFSRFSFYITARYRLETIKGELIDHGESRSIAAYNVVDSPFATRMGEVDARDRATQELAQDIALKLAVYFDRTRRQGAATP